MKDSDQIIQENLNMLFARQKDIDFAYELQADELFNRYSSEITPDSYLAYEIISAENERIKNLPYPRRSGWLNCLSEVIYEKLKNSEDERSMFEDFGFSDYINPRCAGKVSYIKSKFTSLAFDKFESIIQDAKSIYADSFEASCMDVYNGISEYCILPVGNSRDGALSAFKSMISKYDLHVSATTDVEDFDGNYTTLALLSLSIRTPERDHLRGYRFEFSLESLTNDEIIGILDSAEKHGLTVFGVSSTLYGVERPTLTFTFSMEKATFTSFKAFVFTLLAIHPSFLPRGLYLNI